MLGGPQKKKKKHVWGTKHHFERCSNMLTWTEDKSGNHVTYACNLGFLAAGRWVHTSVFPTLEWWSYSTTSTSWIPDPDSKESSNVQIVHGTQTCFGRHPSRFGQTSFDSWTGEGRCQIFKPETENPSLPLKAVRTFPKLIMMPHHQRLFRHLSTIRRTASKLCTLQCLFRRISAVFL